MKKHILTVALATGLVITSSGWGTAHNANKELTEIVDDKDKQISQKSTEIANLENVIVEKDRKLDAEKQVIEKQEDQLQKKQDKISKLEKELKSAKEKLKRENVKANFNSEEKGSDVGGRKLNVKMTAYIAMCTEGCTGKTATGIDVRNITTYQGMKIIATDPNVIPLWSIVRVDFKNGESFKAISLDTGGAINGNVVDYLMSSTSQALEFGKQYPTVTVLREGKGE